MNADYNVSSLTPPSASVYLAQLMYVLQISLPESYTDEFIQDKIV